ncbi:MAG: hypothetical protein JKY84_00595 [Emcibacteraceae bacterium]|nr:hypothetical protein [Emcibacteraceae bacterium]
MMINKIFNIFVVLLAVLFLTGCDSMQEQHKKTLEEKLFEDFRFSEKSVRARVDLIVAASKQKNYILAMNQLGILSATQINNSAQARSIKLLMVQLRFSMEEQDLAARMVMMDKTNIASKLVEQ